MPAASPLRSFTPRPALPRSVAAGPPGFAPACTDEVLRWAGPDAGPLAPAVASDPTRDRPAVLSPAAASGLAARLLGPAAATVTWTPIAPDAATAAVDGRRLLVVDETDPYGCFTSLGLYQLVGCQACGGQHPVPIRPGATAPPAIGGAAGRGCMTEAVSGTGSGRPDPPVATKGLLHELLAHRPRR